MRKRLSELDPGLFREEGERAAGFIAGLSAWEQAETALLFLSAAGEIDTGPLLHLAFSQEKKVFLPRVEGEIARFLRVRSPGGPWRIGAFGIREPLIPAADTPEEFPPPGEVSAPVLVVTPGLAFDPQGNRMGHGKGYYDRFFDKLDRLGISHSTLGLCLEQQLVSRVPVEIWDKKMNAVCTGAGLFTIL
jgi:5-formyltetrahydrofolate cyclo-ligase